MNARLPPNFDRIARAYRWMEYATLGRALERARNTYLASLMDRRSALVLGDGDGRFTAKLLAVCPHIRVEAVDSSRDMLALLSSRAIQHRQRLCTVRADGPTYEPAARPDLVVTHFFLDCFDQKTVDDVAVRLAHRMVPNAIWIVTEFRISDGWMQVPGRVLVRALYFVFGVLTGLQTIALPDHEQAMMQAGLVRTHQRVSLGGLLTSEIWRKPE